MSIIKKEDCLVSCIMIFLDAEKFIDEAIQSVVGQRFSNWELLLVDDGSTDSSSEIARGYSTKFEGKIRYITHDGKINRGMSASRNLGLNNATGKYVAFLDSDDVWLPDFLYTFCGILEKYSEASAVIGSTYYWYSWDGDKAAADDFYHPVTAYFSDRVGVSCPPELLHHFLRAGGAAPVPCSVMVRRDTLLQLGGFNDEFRGLYEDQVLFVKLMLGVTIYVTPDCQAWYRQHDESICATDHHREANARLVFLEWANEYIKISSHASCELQRLVKLEILKIRRPLIYNFRVEITKIKKLAQKFRKSIDGKK